MRIALCVKRDLFGLIGLRALLPRCAGHAVAVFCSDRTRPDETTTPALMRLRMLERELPFAALAALPGGGLDGAADPARWRLLPSVRDAAAAGPQLDFAPDLIVSVRFSHIFRPWLIDAVPHGILNVHPAPLPGYRGLFTPFWQAVSGVPRFGVTLHRVDAGIDTGPVVATAEVPRCAGRSLLWHMGELYAAGAGLAGDAVAALAAGRAVAGTPQSGEARSWAFPEEAAFASLPMPLATREDYLGLLARAFAPDVAAALPVAAE